MSDVLIFLASVEAGAGLWCVVAVAADLRFRIFSAHCLDERQERALLGLGARVAVLAVDVTASYIAYGYCTVVHIVLLAVLAAMGVRSDPLVGAVQMHEDVVTCVDLLAVRIDIRFEITCLMPAG